MLIKDYIIQLLGQYTPLISNGYYEPDIPWIVSAILLVIGFYMVLRIFNSLISRLLR